VNNKQWIEATLAHRGTGRVPYNFMFSPLAQKKAESCYGKPLHETLDLPLRMNGPVSLKPLYADPRQYGETIQDEFGVTWSTSLIDRGSPVRPCLTEPSLAGYTFPDPAAACRYDRLGDWCDRNVSHYRILWVGDLWERATFMRGMENILIDLALHPGFVRGLLRGLTDHILATTDILCSRFDFEGIAVSDDYGTQKAMLVSPRDWRAFIKPLLAQIYGLAGKHGRTVFHHSCGHITPIIGDLIDIGLDILHPIQPETMDIHFLKKEFGDRLTFCGGLRTQDLLAQAAPEDIRREVRMLKETMSGNGGYILEPGITIQADVPLDNIAALIDEARA